MSLTPRSRLISDSIRSPVVATSAITTPITAPCHQGWCSNSHIASAPPVAATTTEPPKPSQDFFGEMVGAIG